MTDTLVSLGGFVFTSWAVPEQVNGGGRQKLVVHRLIGGTRIIDVMGWDADRIAFSGRLRGGDAASGARLLETLSRSGNPVVFSYWTNRYQVVVDRFAWQFERYYEIVYDISLTVLADLTQDVWADPGDTLDDVFATDFSAAQAAASDLPTAGAALVPVASAQASLGVLQGASPAALLPLTLAVGAALQVAQELANSLDGGFPPAPAGGVVGGGDPAVLAASLTAQAGGMQQLGAATLLGGLLTRVQSNLATAPQ